MPALFSASRSPIGRGSRLFVRHLWPNCKSRSRRQTTHRVLPKSQAKPPRPATEFPTLRAEQLKKKRRIKLAKPRLQTVLIAKFLSVAIMGLLLQHLLLGTLLFDAVREIPGAGAEVYGQLLEIMGTVLVLSLVVVVPLLFGVGTLFTFKIVGPIRNFESYFGRIARGEEVGPCALREGDELQDLCRLINEAMEARARTMASDESSPADEDESEAA